jgi:hypothetical protein
MQLSKVKALMHLDIFDISFFKVVVIWYPINGKHKKEREILYPHNKINNRTEIQSLNKFFVITRLSSKVSKDLISL